MTLTWRTHRRRRTNVVSSILQVSYHCTSSPRILRKSFGRVLLSFPYIHACPEAVLANDRFPEKDGANNGAVAFVVRTPLHGSAHEVERILPALAVSTSHIIRPLAIPLPTAALREHHIRLYPKRTEKKRPVVFQLSVCLSRAYLGNRWSFIR